MKDRTYVYGKYQYEIVGDDEQGYEIQQTDISGYETRLRGTIVKIAWFKDLTDAHSYCMRLMPAMVGKAEPRETMEPETFTSGFVLYRITADDDRGFDVYVFDLSNRLKDGVKVGHFAELIDARDFCILRTAPAAPSVMTSGKPLDFTESRRNLRISDLFRIRRDYFETLQHSREILHSTSRLGDNASAIVQTEQYAELVQSDAENRYIHLTLFTIGELEKLDERLIAAPFGFSDGGE